MVKRALCVGCNYPSKAFGLAGAVNDAFLLAECLQENCGFQPENICVLHDVHPGQKKSMKVDQALKPTRVNIMAKLQWLVRNARPGDVLFFSFSGYGLQVDDMDGYQDEGYDEAILPTDFVDGRDGDYSVIVADDIHDILLGIPQGSCCLVLMDCDHATSLIDVAGTLNGGLVDGLKYQTFCGLKGHTTKVQLADHNREVWQEERAREVKARPRFQPMMEIDNPRKGKLPTRPAMSRSSPVAFCFAAAGHGQTAMEVQMNLIVDGKDAPRPHGVLTWCFVEALKEHGFSCTFLEAHEAMKRQLNQVKEQILPKLDQEVLLTFSMPLSDPGRMKVFEPATSTGNMAVERPPGTGHVAPVIVPPPPPGFVKSSALAGTTAGPPPGWPGQAAQADPKAAGLSYQPPGILRPGGDGSKPAYTATADPLVREGQPNCSSPKDASKKSTKAPASLHEVQETVQNWLGYFGFADSSRQSSDSSRRPPARPSGSGGRSQPAEITAGTSGMVGNANSAGANPWVTGTVAHHRPLDSVPAQASSAAR
mmetsp:Transcript_6517/g.15928  ORF Transcript_6517/g.15928 Transcript_6517/m.15928 type:complete len:537 (-) Transcript_6517:53-1663(-)